MSFFGSVEQGVLSRFFLTLTHRNVGEFLIADRNVVLCCDSFDLRCGVDSREQDEEDWNTAVCLSKGLEDIEGRLLNVPLSHHFTDKSSQS